MATARIFENNDGKYYICDDRLDHLDARGASFPTHRSAIAFLREYNDIMNESLWTHYLDKSGRKHKL